MKPSVPPAHTRLPGDWLNVEEPLLGGAVREMQRMVRRGKARWLLVVAVAGLLTLGFAASMLRKKPVYEANISLSLVEGSMARRQTFLPVRDMRNYVLNVLMPGPKLLEIIERNDWYPLRKKLGVDYALEELLDQTDVQVSRNYFLFEDEADAPRSARIDIEVTDQDPDRAYAVADALASLILNTAAEQRQLAAQAVANEARSVQAGFRLKIGRAQQRMFELDRDIELAKSRKQLVLAEQLALERRRAADEARRIEGLMSAALPLGVMEALSEQISEAGQELEIRRIREERPEVVGSRDIFIAGASVICFVVLCMITTAVLGAFDTRIHDLDDVQRLRLPIVGHLPQFPGDEVGARGSRAASQRRVNWRSLWR